MIFTGRTCCGGRNTLDCTATNVNSIKTVKIKNGIYDDFYTTRNITTEYTTVIDTVWNHDTIFYASYDEDINAGNVEFTLQQISSLRIKRRKVGDFNWLVLFDMPINDVDDMKFEKFDKYCLNNTEYEYNVVPMLNDLEGSGSISSCVSEFNELFIIEKDAYFKAILDMEITTQKNKPVSVVETLDRIYPYVVSNSKNNYYSGSLTATFLLKDLNGGFDIDNSFQYRKALMEFLQNGKPKIIKTYDGRMWIASITSPPSEKPQSHPYNISTTFNWTEVGDCESQRDLYDNNLIDYYNG